MNRFLSSQISSPTPGFPLVVAHRGASRYAPENSRLAADIAVAQGADMLELDVRRTADGVLVAYHDAHVNRLPIHTLTLAELRRIAPTLATFEELLQAVTGKVLLDIELKESGYEAAVLEMAARHVSLGDVLVTSFKPDVVRQVRAIEPGVRTGWIVETPAPDDILAAHAASGADWLVAAIDLLDPFMTMRIERSGIPLAVFTVNAWAEMAALLTLAAVDAIITDVPDVALTIRERHMRQNSLHVASR